MATRPRAANDDSRYVNAALYAELEAFLGRMRRNEAREPLAAVDRVARFLRAEARLLDRRQYARWVELLAEDFAYWIPSTAAKSSRDNFTILAPPRVPAAIPTA
jgi:hypothetical protein